MKIIVTALIIVLAMSVSFCWAEDDAVKEAYSLYYKGDKAAAIKMMEAYVKEKPEPGALYFLGYAYYEKKDMDRAMEYFNEAFRVKDFYSPIPPKASQ